MPTQLTSLPDELIIAILTHNVPSQLRSRDDFTAFVRQHAASKRLLRLTRYTFFHVFVHTLDLTFVHTALSRRCVYTQVHVHGVLATKKSFCEQVRQVRLRLRVHREQSTEVAVRELREALGRYAKPRSVSVVLVTAREQVRKELEAKVDEVLEEYAKRQWEERGKGAVDVHRTVELL